MTKPAHASHSLPTRFNAVVTDIQEYSRVGGRTIWRIALNETKFTPACENQTFSAGRLIARARSGAELTAEILDVNQDDTGQIWHHTMKPLQAGTMVSGEIDAA